MPTCLQAAKYVFIRHNSLHGPLQAPYNGPLRVLDAGDKHFVADTGGKLECVSTDRLKLAHLDLDQPVELAQPLWRGCPPAPPLHSNKTSTDSLAGALAPAPVLRSSYKPSDHPPSHPAKAGSFEETCEDASTGVKWDSLAFAVF